MHVSPRFLPPLRYLCVALCCWFGWSVGVSAETLRGVGSDLCGQLGDGHAVYEKFEDRIGVPTTIATPKAVAQGIVRCAAGRYHSLYVTDEGQLWAVGNNDFGQLGDGNTYGRWIPFLVATGVAEVAASEGHSLFVKTDGSLWAMGNNAYGQLGDGTFENRRDPVRIATDVASVAAGDGQSYFVRTDGSLWAMGNNSDGQLGDGTIESRAQPVRVAEGVAAVAGGKRHALFLTSDGRVFAMGSNGYWQFGDGTQTGALLPKPIASDAVAIAAGEQVSFFVKSDGSLWGSGFNQLGQLGSGLSDGAHVAVQVATEVVAVVASMHHTLFRKSDGSLWGMGWNNYGQLGDSLYWQRFTPYRLASGVRAMASGRNHTLYVGIDGTLSATGLNAEGQLADGTADRRWVPGDIADDVVAMSASGGTTFFIKADGSLWGCGANLFGQLGDGTTATRSVPVRVAEAVAAVSAPRDGAHTLFLKKDGTLWGMGLNHVGQLGKPADLSGHPSPELIAQGVAAACAVGDNSYYITTDGSLYGMGGNDQGELGDGTTASRSTPYRIDSDVESVVGYRYHVFYLKKDRTLWGAGSSGTGQFWPVGPWEPYRPTRLADGIRSVAAGADHTLLLKTDGTLWAVGSNLQGEYDNGTWAWGHPSPAGFCHPYYCSPSSTPYQIASDVSACAAGYGSTFYITTDGTLWAMGNGWSAQLGDGTTIDSNRYSPVRIASGVKAVATGVYHTLILGGTYLGATPEVGGWRGAGVTAGVEIPPFWLPVRDADTRPEQLTVSVESSNEALLPPGAITMAWVDGMRKVTIKPTPGVWGQSTVTFRVSDGQLESYLREKVTIYQTLQVVSSPPSQQVREGDAVVLRAEIVGYPAANNYRWRRSPVGTYGWESLEDGETYSGVRTNELRINAASMALDGLYYCCEATADESPGISYAATTPAKLTVIGRTITAQDSSVRATAGQAAQLTVTAPDGTDFQWFRNGYTVAGSGPALAFAAVAPTDVGLYDCAVSSPSGDVLSRPIVLGVEPAPGQRTVGDVATRPEWQNIRQPNGNVYDQFLLTGGAGTFTADSGEIARMSFVDLHDSIVQVEMSGAGAVTVVLDPATASGPAAPALYNQGGIAYMKGKATIILSGADGTTHFTIYSVGTATNPGVTRGDVDYFGWAEVTAAGVVSTDGRLGGIHQGNVLFSADRGYAGLYAPGVYGVDGKVVLHDIAVSATAQPILRLARSLWPLPWVKIAGGRLVSPNAEPLCVEGVNVLEMGAGQDSCGRGLPAQALAPALVDPYGQDAGGILWFAEP